MKSYADFKLIVFTNNFLCLALNTFVLIENLLFSSLISLTFYFYILYFISVYWWYILFYKIVLPSLYKQNKNIITDGNMVHGSPIDLPVRPLAGSRYPLQNSTLPTTKKTTTRGMIVIWTPVNHVAVAN